MTRRPLTAAHDSTIVEVMDERDISPGVDRRRVFVPQALGSEEFLRVTWHERRGLLVFSHWEGDHCVAATPVRAADLEELTSLTVEARASARQVTADWPAPTAGDLVVPATGFALPVERRTA